MWIQSTWCWLRWRCRNVTQRTRRKNKWTISFSLLCARVFPAGKFEAVRLNFRNDTRTNTHVSYMLAYSSVGCGESLDAIDKGRMVPR